MDILSHLHITFQQTWSSFCLRHHPGVIEILVSATAQVVGFLLPAFAYRLLDVLWPTWSAQHKLQPAEQQPSAWDVVDCVVVFFVNHVFLVCAQLTLLAVVGGFEFSRTLFIVDPGLPSAVELVVHCLLGCLLREVLFYYVHRLLHHSPALYRPIHRQHHRFTAPLALSAVYSHAIDHVLENALPIALPMMLLRAPVLTVFVFAVLVLWDAALAHSGYDFFRIPSVEMHDRHHRDMRVGHSILEIMDWLHGTDRIRKKGEAEAGAGCTVMAKRSTDQGQE